MGTGSEGTQMANSPEATDNDLIERIAAADRSAFELLYRRHYAKMFHFVMRMTKQRELAEEVVDDTFFAVWRNASAFAARSSVSTWLFGIGHRQALKALERNRRPLEVACEDDELNAHADPRSDADPQANAAGAEMRTLLGRGIDALSDSHRGVIELAAMGHSAFEIAEIVGCPEATVRTRMFHARAQLTKFLGRAQAPLTGVFGNRKNG
jgi:RNA polymerase sigma factor (sigma-70 family)